MGGELFDIYDDNSVWIGRRERAYAHAHGLWHRAANIFLFNGAGLLLLQRRALNKDVAAGAWDLSVAEHLAVGETYEAAARRGLREELGIYEALPLVRLGEELRSVVPLPGGGCDREFQQCFRTVYDGVCQPDAAEVAELRFIALADLECEMAASRASFTPWFLASVAGVFSAK